MFYVCVKFIVGDRALVAGKVRICQRCRGLLPPGKGLVFNAAVARAGFDPFPETVPEGGRKR